MSNYLAIATVTAALQRTLQAAVQVDVEGARVTTARPNTIGGSTPETGVNLYLYRASPNPAWRNAELTSRTLEGQLIKRPQQVALDLDYLFTCYGDEVALEPQRLLGSVVRTLHAHPVLTRQMVLDTISDSTFSFLAASDLANQTETVKFMPLGLTLEELSNLWSTFAQVPHALSVAYQGTVVLIDTDEPPRKALPVRQRKFYMSPTQPLIQQVLSEAGLLQPIDRESVLLIRGQQLDSHITRVRIGDVEATPQKVTKTEISLHLATLPIDKLRSGVQSLQVIQRPARGEVALPERGVESNIIAFVLRPTITRTTISNLQGGGSDLRSAQITVTVEPTIGRNQRVTLILNERSSTDPASYTWDVPWRDTDTDEIAIPIRDVKPGEYLVRLQVDGAESLLTVDTDATSPTFEQYIEPRTAIS